MLCVVLAGQVMTATATYYYNGEEFKQRYIHYYDRGRIVEYTNLEEFCHR